MTAEEQEKIVEEVLARIVQQSTDVTGLQKVASLNGVESLPAMKGNALVSAPLTLLSEKADEAAAKANAAAEAAAGAENVNAELDGSTFIVTDRNGDTASLKMPDTSEAVIFGGVVSGVTATPASTTTFTNIVYDTTAKRFYAAVVGTGLLVSGVKNVVYYNNWPTRSLYQDETTDVPYANTLYLNSANNTAYAWTGSGMMLLSGNRMVALTQDEYDAMAELGELDDNTYYNVLEE